MRSAVKPIHAPSPGGSRAMRMLGALALISTIASLIAQSRWPFIRGISFSPIEVALWIALAVAVALTIGLALRRRSQGLKLPHLLLAASTVIALAGIEVADAAFDTIFASPQGGAGPLEYLGHVGLAVVVAAALLLFARPARGGGPLAAGLVAIVVLQFFSIFAELTEVPSTIGSDNMARMAAFSAELVELLCVEFYVVAIALAGLRTSTEARRRNMRASVARLSHESIGAKMREIHRNGGYLQRFRHPPLRIAYVPVFRELVLLAVIQVEVVEVQTLTTVVKVQLVVKLLDHFL